jgi:predicted MarR family transcription regulator
MPLLDDKGIEYFNPVVEDWTEECQAIEEDEKNNKCNVHMYCITPEMQGVYSIAEIIHSAHLANTYGTSVDKVVFVVLKDERWSKGQIKSLNATMTLVKNIARENALVGYVSNMQKLIELI